MLLPRPSCGKRCTTAKQPDVTRQIVLEAALMRFHAGGFTATTLDDVLDGTGVTKGALYYHFPNKQALGYAVVDELIRGYIHNQWIKPLEVSPDPIAEIKRIARAAITDMPEDLVSYGCPLNNLTQELSAIDEGFRTRLVRVQDEWRAGIANALKRGQAGGQVRADIDADAAAAFLVASFEGMAGSIKAARSREMGLQLVGAFCQLIEGLRTAGAVQEVAVSG